MQLSMPKVLIFESDTVFADELKLGLGQHGCSVTVVGDATEGLQVAASDRPDLVLLTVELPRINGFSVCNKLKRDPGLKSIPLIIMSSDSNEDTFSQHRRLKHSRAEDYVHKPVSFAELLPRIRTLVALPELTEASDEVVRIHEEPARMDSYLEIDDDLLDSEEDTELDGEFDAELEEVDSVPPEASVDAEVDEFTEHAFDALLEEDQLLPQSEDDPDTKVDATRSMFPPGATPVPPTTANAISVSESPRSRPLRSVVPELASPRLSESEALAALDPVFVAEKDQAIAQLEALLGQANAEAERHKAEALRLSRECEQTRRELAAARSEATGSASGGGSAQDFLSLREALNRKDKELLDLHGQVSQKSKELLAAKDTSLGYEREKADAVGRLLAAERELHEINRVHGAVKADKEQAAKRADDFKRRSEKLAAEAQEKDQAIGSLRAQLESAEHLHRAALVEVTQSAEERLTALEQEKHAALASAARHADERFAAAEQAKLAALAGAAQHAEEQLRQAVESTRAELERHWAQTLEHERITAERAKNAALEHQEARLKTEHEQSFATFAEEKASAYSALERDRNASLTRAEHEIAAARAGSRDLQKQLEAALRGLEEGRAGMAAVRGELERERAQLEATRADLSLLIEQRDELRRELGTAQGDLATLGKKLDVLQSEVSTTRTELTTTRGDLTLASNELAAARVRVERLEYELNETAAELAAARADLQQLQTDFARVHATASAALEKWEQDKDALHKGRAALQTALEQLTQIEGRPLN